MWLKFSNWQPEKESKIKYKFKDGWFVELKNERMMG